MILIDPNYSGSIDVWSGKKVKVNEFGFPNEKVEQLNIIFDVIGSPNEESMGFVADSNAVLYLESIF